MKRLISYLLILPLFATTALLSGCKNSLDELMDIPYDSTKSISFATEMDMATRATPINNASELTSMGVFCAATGLDDWNGTATLNKMFNEQLNNTSGTWTYQNSNIYWGAANITDRYSFFAYTPHASLNNGITVNGSSSTQGKPTLTYIVPTDVSKQPNLMLAVPRYNIRPTSGNIALRMKHALTCIGFQIMGDEEQLTAISILGVAVSGDVVMDGGINVVWTNLGVPTNTDFSASINYDSGENYFTVPSTMTNLIASDGYLMMIPQVLGIDAKIKLSFNDGSTKYISLNTFIWEAGKRITYNITLIPDGTITVTPNEVWLPYTLLNPALHLHVICQKNNGDPAPTMPWTLTSADPSWCLLSVASTDDFNAASASVSGTGTTLIHLLALENQSTNPRQTDIYLGASPLDVVSIVTQWGNFGPITDNAGGGTPPLGVNTYVGAFWRANQIGERIIRIEAGANSANYGKWTAAV
ncbi:MAG: fimbrillin family protein, partial [Prevotellaceae bacterium]|nr:fimbrillin family protein [Prevotellaceae bacterium]